MSKIPFSYENFSWFSRDRAKPKWNPRSLATPSSRWLPPMGWLEFARRSWIIQNSRRWIPRTGRVLRVSTKKETLSPVNTCNVWDLSVSVMFACQHQFSVLHVTTESELFSVLFNLRCQHWSENRTESGEKWWFHMVPSVSIPRCQGQMGSYSPALGSSFESGSGSLLQLWFSRHSHTTRIYYKLRNRNSNTRMDVGTI